MLMKTFQKMLSFLAGLFSRGSAKAKKKSKRGAPDDIYPLF
jgi:hypothetical protein